jgi:hypothetical protein
MRNWRISLANVGTFQAREIAMQYTASLPFDGNVSQAFGLAEAALSGLGFRITQRTAAELELTGPGMNSNRQSPLVGASRIHLRGGHRELVLEAELGGVQRMQRFVMLFPIGLVSFLGVVLTVVFWATQGPGLWLAPVAAATGGNAALWLLLGPLMARSIRSRTCRALDALLANMVAVGQSPEPAAAAG